MSLQILRVTFEHRRDALGIGQSRPRISWIYGGDIQDWLQSAYEIEITRHEGRLENYNFESDASSLVSWPPAASALKSGESVSVRVRAFGCQPGQATPWSESHTVEAGLLQQTDWNCQLIQSSTVTEPDAPHKPVLLRRKFSIAKQIKRARLYATAQGVYEVEINGCQVGDQVLAPGWQNYTHCLEYQTYDVTAFLKNGNNVIGAHLGEGWYAGRLGFFAGGQRNIWGDKLGFISMIHILFEDGETQNFGSDELWRCSTGGLLTSEIYDGEFFDARLRIQEWSLPTYDDSAWDKVIVASAQDVIPKLNPPVGPPVRPTQLITPQTIFQSPSKRWIVDFGQNLVGRLRVNIPVGGEQGQHVIFTHVEVLEHGECATRPLRTAAARDTIILSGKALSWEPKFTFHGFRYVQVDNWPTSDGRPAQDSLTAVVLHTDMERIGYLECSDPLLNQLHSNVVWGMRGNFLSVPTDCPQRDERLGWTGDIQAFCPTANFLYDTTGMLSGWLKGLATETLEDGGCVPPLVSPNVLGPHGKKKFAIWADCLVSAPWDIYRYSGDLQVLSEQYESMKAWLDRGLPRDDRGMWHQDYALQLGDWLDPAAPADDPGNGRTSGILVANAFLCQMTTLMAKISQLLGHTNDAERYRKEVSNTQDCFRHDYITPAGNVVGDSQTAFALAIQFSLFSTPEQEIYAGRQLDFLIRAKSKFKIATGFAGTPIIGHALTKIGYSQLFYRMLMHKKCPSFLYPVTMGATTIWERWDGILPNGDINPGEMLSFNHYALGSVAQWMHEVMGGLLASVPGWKKIMIRPIPGGSLTWVKTRHRTPYGWAAVEWKIEGSTFFLDVSIPPNTTAEVFLPDEAVPKHIGSGNHHFETSYKPPIWPPLPIYNPVEPHNDDQP